MTQRFVPLHECASVLPEVAPHLSKYVANGRGNVKVFVAHFRTLSVMQRRKLARRVLNRQRKEA